MFKFLILYPCTPSALGFSSSAFFLPPSLLLKFQYVCHLVLLALLIYSPPSSTNLCFVCVLFICLTTAWSHISLQKHLLSSAFSITLSLCVSSNSLNNLFWFDSEKRFCLYCSALLLYLSSFASRATSLCQISS